MRLCSSLRRKHCHRPREFGSSLARLSGRRGQCDRGLAKGRVAVALAHSVLLMSFDTDYSPFFALYHLYESLSQVPLVDPPKRPRPVICPWTLYHQGGRERGRKGGREKGREEVSEGGRNERTRETARSAAHQLGEGTAGGFAAVTGLRACILSTGNIHPHEKHGKMIVFFLR